MPTYQYRCTVCETDLEVVQRFTDDPLRVCPECEGSLRKVYNAVGVVFKGSGFYATDSRRSKKAHSATPVEKAPASTPAKSSTGASSAA